MLHERNQPGANNTALTIGDTVLVRETGVIGKITGWRDGKWVITVGPGADEILAETTGVEKRTVLFG